MSKLDFEIQSSPVFFGKAGELNKDDSHKAIYRDDTNGLLSVMSSGYNPLKITDFKEVTNRIQAASGFEFSGYSEFKGGRVILSQLKNNRDVVKIAGNEIKDSLVIGSSFDGSYPIFFGTATTLIRCQNQFGTIGKFGKIRHTKSSEIKLEELLLSIEAYFTDRDKLYEKFNTWNGTSVHADDVKGLIEKIVGLEEDPEDNGQRKINKAESIKKCIETEVNDLGMNLWGTFNGLTRFSSHLMNKKNDIVGNIVGPKAAFNQKAFKLVTELEMF